jgi:hypothetical protein
MRTLLAIIAVALCATHAAGARTHHRQPVKSAAATMIARGSDHHRSDATRDRKIEAICNVC